MHFKDRSATLPRGHDDVAIVRVHDAVRDGQAQSRPGGTRGEERVEQPVHEILRDPAPPVGDSDRHDRSPITFDTEAAKSDLALKAALEAEGFEALHAMFRDRLHRDAEEPLRRRVAD